MKEINTIKKLADNLDKPMLHCTLCGDVTVDTGQHVIRCDTCDQVLVDRNKRCVAEYDVKICHYNESDPIASGFTATLRLYEISPRLDHALKGVPSEYRLYLGDTDVTNEFDNLRDLIDG